MATSMWCYVKVNVKTIYAWYYVNGNVNSNICAKKQTNKTANIIHNGSRTDSLQRQSCSKNAERIEV